MIRADCVHREYRSQHLNSSFRRLARSVLSLSARGILSWLGARVAALTVLFLAVAVPASAQMQLIGNTGQAVRSSPATISSSFTQAQAFTTGTNSAGYTINSVGVRLDSGPSGGGTLSVQIWSTGGGQAPNAVLHTLTNPATYTANAVNTFTATNVTLAANTTYSIVAIHTGNGQTEGSSTSSNNLDGNMAAGWSMNRSRHIRGSAGTWSTSSANLMIAINGSAVAGNSAPTVANSIPDQTITTDASFSYTFPANTFSDPDGDTLTYSLSTGPTWVSLDSATRTFSGTAPSMPGNHVVTVNARDPDGLIVSDPFNIIVTQANRAPTLANALVNQTATTGTAFSYQFAANTFNDLDNDTLTYTASGVPAGLSFNANNRTFSGTPTATGTHTITVTATDPDGEAVNGTFTITVSQGNRAPTLANALMNQATTTGATFSYQFAANTFNDLDNDTLTYTTSTLPAWLSFNAGNRTFSGTPTTAGTHTITVTATDPDGETASGTFTITVMQTNRAPTVANAIPNQTATESVAFNYTFAANTFNDLDNDTLTYTSSGEPAWLTFNAGTRTFSGTPTAAGTHTITVTATDPSGETASSTFTITVAAATPVSLSIPTTAVTVAEDGGITLNVTPDAAPDAQFTVIWAVAAGSGANAISRTGDSGDDAGSIGDWPDLEINTDASEGGGMGGRQGRFAYFHGRFHRCAAHPS